MAWHPGWLPQERGMLQQQPPSQTPITASNHLQIQLISSYGSTCRETVTLITTFQQIMMELQAAELEDYFQVIKKVVSDLVMRIRGPPTFVIQ
jgi:hypothetical protein